MKPFWKNRTYWSVLLIAIIIILGIDLTFYMLSVKNENERINELFDATTMSINLKITSVINNLIEQYELMANSFGTHGDFSNISLPLFNRLVDSNLFTVAYDPIVNHSQRALFESHFTEQLGKNVSILYSFPNRSTIISPVEDFYVPIGYTSFPSLANGIDLYQIPNRKSVLDIAINEHKGAVSDIGLFLTLSNIINIILIAVPVIDMSDSVNAVLAYVLFIEDFFKETVIDAVFSLNIDGHIIYQNILIYSSLTGVKYGDDYNNIIANAKLINTYTIDVLNKQFTLILTDTFAFDNNINNNDKIITLIIGVILLGMIVILITYLFYINQKNKVKIYNTSKLATERAYQRVLSYICHEIRNPLNVMHSILYYLQLNKTNYNDYNQEKLKNTEENNVELLNDGDTMIKSTEMSTLINSTFRIKCIVDEVLSVQKLIEGKVSISIQKINVMDFVSELLKQNSLNINSDIIVSLHATQDLINNPEIYTDSSRLTQIILNGLTNAIKFTYTGDIMVRLVKIMVLDKTYLSVELLNTGIGLKDLNVNTLFIPFSQGNASENEYEKNENTQFLDNVHITVDNKVEIIDIMNQTKTHKCYEIWSIQGHSDGRSVLAEQKGSGLGLPIARMISIRLGGYLTLEDDKKYTRYHSIIECESEKSHTRIDIKPYNFIKKTDIKIKPSQNETQLPQNIEPKDIHILIVDDTPDNLRLGKLVFTKLGYNVDTVEDGIYIDYDHINNYNIILLDIIMKHSSGLDICRKILSKNYKGIVLATTGNLTEEDINVYYKYNFNGVYGKPFVYHKCHEFFTKLLSTREWDILY